MPGRQLARFARQFAIFVTAGFALAGLGCSGDATGAAQTADDGSLRGDLLVTIADRLDGHSDTRYALRDDVGVEHPLLFDGSPAGLEPGARMKVWGVAAAEGFRVTSFQSLPPELTVNPAALVAGAAHPVRTFAFVFVDIGGGVTGTVTPSVADGIMTSNADSIRNYFLDASYGRQDIATYVAPVALSYPMADCSVNTMNAMANALRSKVGNYEHYLWYFGSDNPACDWNGLASLGSPSNPSRDTWYNHVTSCVVLVQEPGHNLGMQHSSSLVCPGATYADDPNTCIDDEYGDVFDPMGNGCRHMNAWQKTYQGWMSGCNGVKISDSGTFNLVPFEDSCRGAQFLQIKSPKVRTFNRPAGGGVAGGTETLSHYYVELRTPHDFDGALATGSRPLTPMVLIHVASDLRTGTQAGLHTFLLDMTPSTTNHTAFSDAGLVEGETFTDPAGGLSITAQLVTATGATIVVNYAAGSGAPALCLDGSRFEAPGPGVESCSADGSPPPDVSGSIDQANLPATAGSGGCSIAARSGRRSPVGAGLLLAAAAIVAARRRARRPSRSAR